MTKTISIHGVVVTLQTPYAEGHVVTEAEAMALNQTRAENIGNNRRKEIKALIDEAAGSTDDEKIASVQEAVQAMISAYEAEYVFTKASVGGGSATRLDPLTKMCQDLAKSFISGKLKEMGMTAKAYLEANGEDAIKNKVAELQDNEQIVAAAKKALREREKMTAGLAL
jgi:hypothetical protein